jgi:hypothetical protein
MDQVEFSKEIARLRASNRRLFVFTACVLLLLIILAAVDRLAIRSELRVRRLLVIDTSGRSIAALRPEEDGACLDLSGTSKTAMVTLCSADDLGSYVSLVAQKGKTNIILSTGESLREAIPDRAAPRFVLSTGNGQNMFRVNVGTNSELVLGNGAGGSGLSIYVPHTGQPVMNIK